MKRMKTANYKNMMKALRSLVVKMGLQEFELRSPNKRNKVSPVRAERI
jgi:hypothetical protein